MNKAKEQEKEFLAFLENYKKLITKVSGIYCHVPEERKDLIQEIIIQLWKSFPKYDHKYPLSTWTYRIAINVSISFLRKNTTQKRAKEGYRAETQWMEFDPPPRDERLDMLYRFIDLLKPIDKAIIMLYLEEHSNKEIAEIMGLSVSNVSTRKLRIKDTLKHHFEINKKG
ncbi:RNA polymerase sigma factor [Marinilabilia rubra]|uniref:RNA polymerase subunit sigma-70 n=1 Tax=Marinilabilia rubra TaxID=2162893 RepID=A0A2U2B4Z7_9BACT|nr:sigma-70 family RNA polymerase sigma factor [Marinilabilia rubra]PWD98151.1 RNA polymerase subunit sigma-70 [Marinilabilia rubra]